MNYMEQISLNRGHSTHLYAEGELLYLTSGPKVIHVLTLTAGNYRVLHHAFRQHERLHQQIRPTLR